MDPLPLPGHLHTLMGSGWLLPTLMVLVGAVTIWTLLSGPRKGR